MQLTSQSKAGTAKSLMPLAIILMVIFICYSLSLQSYCTGHEVVVSGSILTARQADSLHDYMDRTLSQMYPGRITGYAPTGNGLVSMCLNVYIGPDQQLDNILATGNITPHNEIWSMWYFFGWHRLGTKVIAS